MNFYTNPDYNSIQAIIKRPVASTQHIQERVRPILSAVREEGDTALRRYAKQFDNVELPENLRVTEEVLRASENELSEELKQAIHVAYENIRRFHQPQFKSREEVIETMPGVACWRVWRPIERVGFYIPGGSAPLFSTVLMLGVPAQLAGASKIVLCSPSLHPAIRYAALLVGVTDFFQLGGAQAVAAMAYGTEQVPKVDKIFGPGNQYVMAAKSLVSADGVAIDMPAGPSEVAVLADDTAHLSFIASDLLSQAEHGPDSQVILVTTSDRIVDGIRQEVERQIQNLTRKDFAGQSLANSSIVKVETLDEALGILNDYAAEHLILACDNPHELVPKINHAGSIFLGHYTPESCGDYASGTNHTLPTNGFARAYSGVSVDSFVKKITVQQISEEGLQKLGPTVITMAEAEELKAHAEAVRVRLR